MKRPVLPPDDLTRKLRVVDPDDAGEVHLSLVGDTYTVLLSGEQTGGKYCLIDMHIPPGGGPPPHRHDFEESFTVLAGEVEFTFREERHQLRSGQTVHIPANAPHRFQNTGTAPARLLCICAPAGQEQFFAAVAAPVAGRTSPPPPMDPAAAEAVKARAVQLASQYRTELISPPRGG